MNDKSAAALEREAEAVRSQVASTAESLREKMTPGELFEEFTHYFRNSDGTLALNNLKNQIRDNPLPLALVGIGLGWLMLGGGPSTNRLRHTARGFRDDYYTDHDDYDDEDDLYGRSSYTDDTWDDSLDALGYPVGSNNGSNGNASSKGALRGAKDAMSNAASTVSGAAGSAYSAMGDAAHLASDAASSAAHAVTGASRRAMRTGRRMARTGRWMADRSARVSHRAQDNFVDILDREPLILAGLGIAVGAAVGALLPRSRYEDEYVGPYRDQLRDEAGRLVHEGVEQAKDVASETYRAVKDEADRQGLNPSKEGSVTGRVSKVAETAAKTAESSIREKAEASKPSA